MSEIVSINGGPAPQARRVRSSVVELLEEALERARSGDLQAVCLVEMSADERSSWAVAGLVGGSYGLVGASVLMTNFLVGECSR